MIKKKLFLMPMAAILFAACGDSVENVNQMGMEIVESVKDLPKCTSKNEGEQAFVKGESSARICVDGEWFATVGGDGSSEDFSCTTQELKDKSGLKIVCNGDSIGVVLNGEKGDKGEAGDKGDTGVGCTISGQTDSTVTIACGDKKLTMDMNGGFSVTESILDSEKVAVSLDSLAGYTQKGPFLKGSTVYLYELSDGRTLKQTNGNFTSKITRDDGHYKFTARDLASQYAMIVVDGHYRNEVTGSSDGPLRLTALTDMRKRSSTNVNLLTHLEYDRVYQLVTRGDSTGKKLTVKQAKRQAQKEILKQFYIELDDNTDAEDMDVFGSSDADAALLAISILLQLNRSTTDLSVLLTEISNDISEYGEWKNSVKKTEIADWAMEADSAGDFAKFSKNVTEWGLGAAPDFAKYVRNFWYTKYGLGDCTSKRNGELAETKNSNSHYHNTKTRFICKNGAWAVATDLEKDRNKWQPENKKDGELLTGPFTGKKIVWDADTLRYAKEDELAWNKGCVSYLLGENVLLDGRTYYDYDYDIETFEPQYSYYKCTKKGWTFTLDVLNTGTVTDKRDGNTYKTIGIVNQMWMAENLNYAYEGSACAGGEDGCDEYGRLYTWAAAKNGICPEGWSIPTENDFRVLLGNVDEYGHIFGNGTPVGTTLKSTEGWNAGGNGTDEFGFNVLPVGGTDDESFGKNTGFWTSSVSTTATNTTDCSTAGQCAFHIGLSWNRDTVSVQPLNKMAELSVRCIKK